MHIETKFSNGDRVFYATVRRNYVAIPCDGCAGSGRLAIQGRAMTVACPDCGGRGEHSRSEPAPAAQLLTIGRVGVEITDSSGSSAQLGDVYSEDGNGFSNYSPMQKREEKYMCCETGIGSGSVYSVEDLFVTEAEAIERAAWKILDFKKYEAEETERRERDRLSIAAQYAPTEEESA